MRRAKATRAAAVEKFLTDHKQRWSDAKERYVANGDAQELAYEAGTWLRDEPFIGITFSIANAAVEVAELMIERSRRMTEEVPA